MRLFIAP
ncbi:hypothetical protein R3I94_017081 [Phoxinus phoxinus]